MSSALQKLPVLSRDWMLSNERVQSLSRINGRDHTELAALLAREFAYRRQLKAQILRLQEEIHP